jgi:hypothetical protein
MSFEAVFILPAWGYLLVALVLTHITIASVTRLTTRSTSKLGKHLVDRETARAVVSQRFYILKCYRLRTWCAASEQSGIRALEEFVVYLRGYQLETI